MPEPKVIKLDTSETENTLKSLNNTLRSLSSSLTNNQALKTAGQVGAFAGTGYGVYRLATSEVAQPATQGAISAGNQLRNSVDNRIEGLKGAVQTRDSYGRFYRPGYRQYAGQERIMNEAIGSLGGATAGVGSAAATIGGGLLLNQLGVGSLVTGAASSVGKAAGGTLASAPIKLAGGGLSRLLAGGATGLNNAGMTGAGSALGGLASGVGSATSTVAGGAKTAGTAIGGIAGSMVPAFAGAYAINQATDTIVDNISNQMGAERELDQMSFRFTPGMATNLITGRGLGYDETSEIAEGARKSLTNEKYLRQGDFSDILEGIVEGDLLYNVRGAEEFQEKFEKVTGSIRDIAQIFQTTLEDATELLGEMQQSGFYTVGEQADAAITSDAIGRMTGYTGEEMIQIGQRGSASADRYGLRKSVGFEGAQSSALGLETIIQDLEGTPEQQRLLETVQELGGREEATQTMNDFFMQQAGNNRQMQQVLFGLINTDTMQVDQDRLQSFLSGETSYREAFQRGAQNIDSSEMWGEFQTNAKEYFQQLEGPEFLQFMGQSMHGIHETSGREAQGLDIEATLKTMGVQDPRERQVMARLFEGGQNISQEEIEMETIQNLLRERSIQQRSPSGFMERYVKHPLGQLGYGISRPFVGAYQGVKGGWRNLYNRWHGVEEFDTSLEEVSLNQGLNVEDVLGTFSEEDRESIRKSYVMQHGQNYEDEIDYRDLIRTIESKQEGDLKRIAGGRLKKGEMEARSAYGIDVSSENILENVDDVFRDEFTGLLKTGLEREMTRATNLEPGEEGRRKFFDEKAMFEYEGEEFESYGDFLLHGDSGLSKEQKQAFSLIEQGFKSDISKFLEDESLSKEERQEKMQEVYDKYSQKIRDIKERSGVSNALQYNEIIEEDKMKQYIGKFQAEGKKGAEDIARQFIDSEAGLSEKIQMLYDEDFVSALGADTSMRNILEIGQLGEEALEDGELTGDERKEIIAQLESTPEFKNKDLTGLTEADSKEEFSEMLNEILSEEFIRDAAGEGSVATKEQEVEDYKKLYEEDLQDLIMEQTNVLDDVKQVIDQARSTMDRMDSNR
ncbi:MAG: hypothetical protein ACOCT9_00055 [archaeon]